MTKIQEPHWCLRVAKYIQSTDWTVGVVNMLVVIGLGKLSKLCVARIFLIEYIFVVLTLKFKPMEDQFTLLKCPFILY